MHATLDKIDYRNAVYQGAVRASLRHGPGSLLTDQAQLVIGYWSDDHIDGPFL